MGDQPVTQGTIITCIAVSTHGAALTRGKQYTVLVFDPEREAVYIEADGGRYRWFPLALFDPSGGEVAVMTAFHLSDPISDPREDCIEVTLELSDGGRRVCFFATPRWIADHLELRTEPKLVRQGNLRLGQITLLAKWLQSADGSPVGMVNIPNLIILSRLTPETIERALRHMDQNDELLASTQAY
jgi:hypothetical protein